MASMAPRAMESMEAFGSIDRASAERDPTDGRTATMARRAVKRTSKVVTFVGAVTLALVDGARCAEAKANDDANGANTLDARRLERADSSAVVEVMEDLDKNHFGMCQYKYLRRFQCVEGDSKNKYSH